MPKKLDVQPIDKTELVWPGKRTEVERVELPFQTIETINLPRGQRQEGLFDTSRKQEKLIKDKTEQPTLSATQDTEWKNRLIWGDNLLIMGSLLKEFAGKINLIYIDPPFFTGTDQIIVLGVGESDEQITKEPSMVEEAAYRNVWRRGSASYFQWLQERLTLMRELLTNNGIIFIRHDQYWSHYVKVIADEVFGKSNFQNEIVVKRIHKNVTQQGRISIPIATDSLLAYFKSPDAHYYDINRKLDEPRESYWRAMDSAGIRPNPARTVECKTFYPPTGRHFTFTQKKVEEMYKVGRVRIHPKIEKLEYLVEEADTMVLNSNWTDISGYSFTTGYPTENAEPLLERVIKAGSQRGDLVADFFCGSGTTGAVADRLQRRWIMSDLGRFAIHTSRKRLLDMSAKPFVVQNLGKYERHRWVQLNGRYKNYLKFILELYHAEMVEGFTNLHGKKDRAFVRVGAVDAPITLSEIREALSECKENKIKALDVLGWEWEMGLHDLVKEEAERYGVKLSTFQIPREVMELNVSDPKVKEDIHFYELAYLEVELKTEPFDKAQGRGRVVITLKDFIIPNPELLPEEVKDKVKNWSDFIDYWSVDWMFNQHEEETDEDDTFHNMNQEYRTRKNPKLTLSMNYDYKKSGKYNILVKVIDIFGNDTTKLIQVKV